MRTKFLPRAGLRMKFRMSGGYAKNESSHKSHAGGDSGHQPKKNGESRGYFFFLDGKIQKPASAQGIGKNSQGNNAKKDVFPIGCIFGDPRKISGFADFIPGLLYGICYFIFTWDICSMFK